jgi:hypothetical protein
MGIRLRMAMNFKYVKKRQGWRKKAKIVDDQKSLKDEKERLTARNEEIRRIKLSPRFRVITNEIVKAYTELEDEERKNQEKINGINKLLR